MGAVDRHGTVLVNVEVPVDVRKVGEIDGILGSVLRMAGQPECPQTHTRPAVFIAPVERQSEVGRLAHRTSTRRIPCR